jgi:hypothetical protein
MGNRYNFASGGGIISALREELLAREIKRREAMLEEASASDRALRQAQIEQQMEIQRVQEARAQEESRLRAEEQAQRVRDLDDARVERVRRRSDETNVRTNTEAINASVADAIPSGQVNLSDPNTANMIRSKYLASGLEMPAAVTAMLQAPKAEAPVKLHIQEHDGDLVAVHPVTGEIKLLKQGRPKSTAPTEAEQLSADLKRIQVEERQDKLDTARLARTQAAQDTQRRAQETIADIDALLADTDGMAKATGAFEMRGGSQAAIDWNAKRRRVVAALTLPNLGTLKGPMSDRDVEFVKSIASVLGEGRLSEQAVRDALTRARQALAGGKTATGIDPARIPGLIAPIRSSR